MCVGKFEERKNHGLMVACFSDAAAGLGAHSPSLASGSSVGHERYLESLRAISMALSDRVGDGASECPIRKHDEMYGQHDVFVLPSRDEPLGVVVLEAMSCGLPVICSDTGRNPVVHRAGGNGYVFKSDDARISLSNCADPAGTGGVERMSLRSLELVAARHSSERYYESLMAAMNGATGRSTPRFCF